MHAPAVLPDVDKVPSARNRADRTDDGARAAAARAQVGVSAPQQQTSASAPSLWQRRIAARGAPAAGLEPAPLAPLASLNIPSDTAPSAPGIPSPIHSASRSALPSPLPISRPAHTPLYSVAAEPKTATNANHSDSLSWDWISSAQGPRLWAPPNSAGLGPCEPRPFNASSPATDLHRQDSRSLSASVSQSPPMGHRATPSPLPTPEHTLKPLPSVTGGSSGIGGTTTQQKSWVQQQSSFHPSPPPPGSSDRLWYPTTTGVGDRQGTAHFPLRTAPPTATEHSYASPGVDLGGRDDMRAPATAIPPGSGAPRKAQVNRSQSSHVATQVALSALSIDDDDGYPPQSQTQTQPNNMWGLPPVGQLVREQQEARGPLEYSDVPSHLGGGGQYEEHETYEPREMEGEYDYGYTLPPNELGSNSSYGPNGEDRSRRKGRARMSQEKRRRLARRREREREAAQTGSGANPTPAYPSGGSRPSMTSSSGASYLSSGASLLSRPSSLNLPASSGSGVNSLPPHPSTTWAQAHANEATPDSYYGGHGRSLRPNQLGLDAPNLGPNPVSSGPTGSINTPGYASGTGLGYPSGGAIPTPHNRPAPLPPHTATGWNRTSGLSTQQHPHHINGPHTSSSSPHPNYQPDPTAPPRSAPAHISSFTLPPVPVPLPPQHGPRTTHTPPSRQMPLPTGPASRLAQGNPKDNWGGSPASLGGVSSGPDMASHAVPSHSAIPLPMNQAQRFPSSSPLPGGPQALYWRSSSSHTTAPHVPSPRSHQSSPARSFSSPNAAAAAAAATTTSGHTPFYYARPENPRHSSEQLGSGLYLPAYRSYSRSRAPASPRPAGSTPVQPSRSSHSYSGQQPYPQQGSSSSQNGLGWNVQPPPSQPGPPQPGPESHDPVEQALAAGYAAGLAAGQRALAARRVYE